ncbi:thioredoxin domain-containing protein [Geoglobus acetivorans]|uniref:Thioredoxin family protein n=1 Tax=Geoglobus acetivorans TaxID=565033 RepID=A0ABZ3H676_GEOAI|nr:thioredoxin family protein [Geoglobus acetivorans]
MGLMDRLFRRGESAAGKPISVDQSSFDEFLKSSRYAVVDFWGKNCPPCEAMEPILKKLAREYEGRVVFLKVNAASSPEISRRFRVKSVPAFLFFENGRLKGRRVGAMSYETFKKWMESMMS